MHSLYGAAMSHIGTYLYNHTSCLACSSYLCLSSSVNYSCIIIGNLQHTCRYCKKCIICGLIKCAIYKLISILCTLKASTVCVWSAGYLRLTHCGYYNKPSARMRSEGYCSRCVCLSVCLSVCSLSSEGIARFYAKTKIRTTFV